MDNSGLTNTVFMVEPVSFQLNKETVVNNYYQTNDQTIPLELIQKKALKEFFMLQKALESNGIKVFTLKDTRKPFTPDSIFPNNWISFHNNKVILYPMFAENRRYERRLDAIILLLKKDKQSFTILDYSNFEKESIFLEGTGSMVLDRKNNIAYCSLSERSNASLFLKFCKENAYQPISFTSYQTVNKQRKPIYHTNVMMSIGNRFAMICLDAIDNPSEKEIVKTNLINSGKEIIYLTEDQIAHFAGNTLQLINDKETFIVMSEQAKSVLTVKQLEQLERYSKIISVSIPTIEKFGGGSVRCMLAEVF